MDPFTLLTFAAGTLFGVLAARMYGHRRDGTHRAPGYGLDLQERVWLRFGVRLGMGIYTTLRTLESEGFLRTYEVIGPETRGGHPRVMYALNEHRLAA